MLEILSSWTKWELRNCIIALRNCLLQSWPASWSRFLIIWTIIWSGRFSKSFNNSFGVSIWSPCNLFTMEMHMTEPFTPALLQNERKRLASISMLRMPCWNNHYPGENGRWSLKGQSGRWSHNTDHFWISFTFIWTSLGFCKIDSDLWTFFFILRLN